MRHLMTSGLFLGIPLAVFVLWIEASEPKETDDASLPARLVSPEVRPADGKQEDEHPFGISRLSTANTSTGRDERTDDKVGADDRRAAFREFHDHFRDKFSMIDGEFGFARIPRLDVNTIKHSVRGGSIWTVFKSSLGVRIVAKPLFWQADSEIPKYAVVLNTSLSNDATGFPDFEELQSLRYLGAIPNQSFGASTFGLFEQTADMINEPISRTEWKLVRLELIGLLKHEAPVSYTSQSIPKMGQLNSVPTAPLNSFEKGAIDRLRSNPAQDAVIHNGKDEVQIVGALRATQRCQTCHDVKHGELLGGLTYRLIKSREITRRRGELRNEERETESIHSTERGTKEEP